MSGVAVEADMSMADVFRRRADVTEAFARGLPSPMDRDRYLRLAKAFRDLAAEAEAADRSQTEVELADADALRDKP